MARQPKQPSNAPMPSWDCNSWARVPTGRYQGVAVRTQGPEWVRRYRRWSILVEFELLSGDGVVPCFYNLGSNPERPHAGRMSRYFQAWCLANSEPPRQWQQLDPATFMDGQVYTIEVTDGLKDHEGNLKPDGTVHSRVTAIIAVESPNQAIRQSGNHPPVPRLRGCPARVTTNTTNPKGRGFRLPLRQHLPQWRASIRSSCYEPDFDYRGD